MEEILYPGQRATFGSKECSPLCNRRHTFPQTFWKNSSSDGLKKVCGGAWSPWAMNAFGPLQAEVGRHWAPCAAALFNLVHSLPQGNALGVQQPKDLCACAQGYHKRWSGKAHEIIIDLRALGRIPFSSLMNFRSPSLDFSNSSSPVWHLSVTQFGFSDVLFQSSSLELELKRMAKSLNQRPGFINKTSTYFIALFNNIFLFYSCSAEEAEQQQVELLLILHITINY